MDQGKFLHIAFNFRGPTKVQELEPIFNQGVDWVRYAPNCWIVWTTSNAETWYSRLKPSLGPNDTMLIIRVDRSERHGWLPKWIWEWLDRVR